MPFYCPRYKISLRLCIEVSACMRALPVQLCDINKIFFVHEKCIRSAYRWEMHQGSSSGRGEQRPQMTLNRVRWCFFHRPQEIFTGMTWFTIGWLYFSTIFFLLYVFCVLLMVCCKKILQVLQTHAHWVCHNVRTWTCLSVWNRCTLSQHVFCKTFVDVLWKMMWPFC